tara:strand:+ start:168 stop:323 length:156 start_codon:yes stop_codon:yes gene_type:complete
MSGSSQLLVSGTFSEPSERPAFLQTEGELAFCFVCSTSSGLITYSAVPSAT